MLALLIARYPGGVTADALSDELWGTDAPPTSGTGLRVVVNRLRERFGGTVDIAHEADGYRLIAEPHALDISQFDLAVDEAGGSSGADPQRTVDSLTEALGLWHGRPFQQCEASPALTSAITLLDQRRLDAEERLIDAHLQLGHADRAVALATDATAAEPFRERRWELLLRSLYAAGRHAEALRQVRRAAQVFGDELGLDLSPRLRGLETAILTHDSALEGSSGSGHGDVSDAARAATPISAPSPTPSLLPARHRAPVPASSFFGRERDLDRLAELVEDSPLVSILGPAGAGKTRLVAEFVAADPDVEQVWVDLTSASARAGVAAALAQQLGLRTSTDPIEHIAEVLSGRRTTLVIDNCDHSADTVAGLAEALIRRLSDIRIIVTSRTALGCESETRLDLGGLPNDAACRLLRNRAFGASPASAIELRDLDELAEQLDGLPLAIELVAAQLRVLDPARITERLRSSLAMLAAPRRTDERHRRLADTIDDSLVGLPDEDVELLEQLAVLAGPFTLDDVLDVAQERTVDGALSSIQTLVDHSLLHREQRRNPTFRLLSTVRTRGIERLSDRNELEQAQRSTAIAVARVADQYSPDLRTAREEIAVVRLASSVHHLAQSFETLCTAADLARAGALAIQMHDYSILRLKFEHFGWAERVLVTDGASDLVDLAELQATAALQAWADQRFTDGERWAAASLSTSDQRCTSPVFRALNAQFNLAAQQGRFDEAGGTLAELMSRPNFRDDDYEAVLTLGNLTLGLVHSGASEAALRAAIECLPIAERSGNASLLAWAQHAIGAVQSADQPAEAIRSYNESIRLAVSVDNLWSQGLAMSSVVSCLRRLDRTDQAAAMTVELIEHWSRARFDANLRHALSEAALLLLTMGQPDLARRTLSAVDGTEGAHPLSPTDVVAMTEARLQLGRLPVGIRMTRPLLDEVIDALR